MQRKASLLADGRKNCIERYQSKGRRGQGGYKRRPRYHGQFWDHWRGPRPQHRQAQVTTSISIGGPWSSSPRATHGRAITGTNQHTEASPVQGFLKGQKGHKRLKDKNRRFVHILSSIRSLNGGRSKASACSNIKDQQATSPHNMPLQHLRSKQAAAPPPQGEKHTVTSARHPPVNKAAETASLSQEAPVAASSVNTNWSLVACHAITVVPYKQDKGAFWPNPTNAGTGKSLEEVKTQIMKHAERMEEAHREVAYALAKGCFMDVIEELANMPFQKFKAKVAELAVATQVNSLRTGVPKQEGSPEPSKESGRGPCKALQPSIPTTSSNSARRRPQGIPKSLPMHGPALTPSCALT